ncbi:MAG: SDR family NAD(P)-dependent oxidoreductase [Nitriliruptoraceae bacterium]
MRFTDKVVVVTGGASGIGRATAVRFAAEGASVVVADVTDDAGNETVAMITEAGGQAVYQHADVSSDADAAALVATAAESYGGLDIAVNNAGILGHFMPAADIPLEEFDRIMAINVRGVFLGIKHQLPAIVQRGGGAIVNVASAAGYLAQPFAAAYTASKHAVLGLTKAAALDHARSGVRINSVCPGGVATNIAAHLDLSGMGDAPDPHPIGRSADPAEIATAILWVASEEASFVIGSNVLVDGGLTLKLG